MGKYKPNQKHSEEELVTKLFNTMFAIVVLLIVLLLSFKFLAPKLGSFFGLISVNRNDSGNKDLFAPLPPEFIDPPKATNKKTISLSGSAEPGATVELFVNGPKKDSVIADQSGEFNFVNVSINSGKNSIFAFALDNLGNKSEKSETVTVAFDNTKPKIEILEPNKDQVISNLQNRILVKGKVDEKAQVTINDRIAITRPDNTFELLLGVKEGEIEINVVATDEAGNIGKQRFAVKYTKD